MKLPLGAWFSDVRLYNSSSSWFDNVFCIRCSLIFGLIQAENFCTPLTLAILLTYSVQNLFPKLQMNWLFLGQGMLRWYFIVDYHVLLNLIGFLYLFFCWSNSFLLQVRLFNLSRVKGREQDGGGINPLALFQCHTRRVKKLAVNSSFFPFKSYSMLTQWEQCFCACKFINFGF